MLPELILEKPRDKRLLICLDEYKGKKYFKLAEQWLKNEDNGDQSWQYSKKVITFNGENLEALRNYLNEHKDILSRELTAPAE